MVIVIVKRSSFVDVNQFDVIQLQLWSIWLTSNTDDMIHIGSIVDIIHIAIWQYEYSSFHDVVFSYECISASWAIVEI